MQTKSVLIEFTNEINPGTAEQLDQILENYFRAKGVKYENSKITV